MSNIVYQPGQPQDVAKIRLLDYRTHEISQWHECLADILKHCQTHIGKRDGEIVTFASFSVEGETTVVRRFGGSTPAVIRQNIKHALKAFDLPTERVELDCCVLDAEEHYNELLATCKFVGRSPSIPVSAYGREWESYRYLLP